MNMEHVPVDLIKEIIIRCEILAENALSFLPALNEAIYNCFATNISRLALYMTTWEEDRQCTATEIESCEAMMSSRFRMDIPTISTQHRDDFMHFVRG